MAMLIRSLSAKLGITTGRSLPELIRDHFPPSSGHLPVGSCQAGGHPYRPSRVPRAALGLNLLFGIPMFTAALITGVLAFLILRLERYGCRDWAEIGLAIVRPRPTDVESMLLAGSKFSQKTVRLNLAGGLPGILSFLGAKVMDFNELLVNLFVPGVSILEKVIRPILVYAFLVVALRIGGRRELAQLNSFDLVVLLTISNTVQNAIIGNDNSLLGGLVGAATLVLVNAAVVRYLYGHPTLERRLEGGPVWLVRDGRVITENLRRELITEDELLAAIRRQGVGSVAECDQVILEASGTITVIPRRPTALEEILARLDRLERTLSPGGPGPTGPTQDSGPSQPDRPAGEQPGPPPGSEVQA